MCRELNAVHLFLFFRPKEKISCQDSGRQSGWRRISDRPNRQHSGMSLWAWLSAPYLGCKLKENLFYTLCLPSQRPETNWQHPLHPHIMWLSWPAIHLQWLCVGAPQRCHPESLFATPCGVHLWAPTAHLLSATSKCKLNTEANAVL